MINKKGTVYPFEKVAAVIIVVIVISMVLIFMFRANLTKLAGFLPGFEQYQHNGTSMMFKITSTSSQESSNIPVMTQGNLYKTYGFTPFINPKAKPNPPNVYFSLSSQNGYIDIEADRGAIFGNLVVPVGEVIGRIESDGSIWFTSEIFSNYDVSEDSGLKTPEISQTSQGKWIIVNISKDISGEWINVEIIKDSKKIKTLKYELSQYTSGPQETKVYLSDDTSDWINVTISSNLILIPSTGESTAWITVKVNKDFKEIKTLEYYLSESKPQKTEIYIPGTFSDDLTKVEISKISQKIEIDKISLVTASNGDYLQTSQKEQVYIYKTSLIADYQKLRSIIN